MYETENDLKSTKMESFAGSYHSCRQEYFLQTDSYRHIRRQNKYNFRNSVYHFLFLEWLTKIQSQIQIHQAPVNVKTGLQNRTYSSGFAGHTFLCIIFCVFYIIWMIFTTCNKMRRVFFSSSLTRSSVCLMSRVKWTIFFCLCMGGT